MTINDDSARPRGGTDATGLLYAIGAYGTWGMFPVFFPLLQPASAPEVLAHRIVWTAVFMAVVLIAVGRVSDLWSISGRTWLLLACASILISINWIIYVYAVNNGHVVDAALGYFINPLVSVLFGMVIFGERLNRAQSAAVLIALVAIIVLSVETDATPLIGLGLAMSFGLYGVVKKVVTTDPRVSVAVEAGIAAPMAVVFLLVLQVNGHGQFTNHGPGHATLMALSGPLTAIPLLMFAAAAQRLPLVTLGLLMYFNPALQMTWGILVGHEPMPPARWIGFGLIWVALVVFSADALSRAYRGRAGKLLLS
ncbi:MAG: EamA family transporter RarD [Mycobacteriaceae bacterium]